jgi:hypothetical protein
MSKHQRKLEEIHKSSKKLVVKQVEEELKRKKDEKKMNTEFLLNERNIEIDRDNKKLLGKLVEISAGKWSQVKKDMVAGQ